MRDFYLELKASLPGLAVDGFGAGFGVGSFRDRRFVLREYPLSHEERSSGWSTLFHRFLEKLSPHPHSREPQWLGPLA